MHFKTTVATVPTSPWTQAQVHSVEATHRTESLHVGAYASAADAANRARRIRAAARKAGQYSPLVQIVHPTRWVVV